MCEAVIACGCIPFLHPQLYRRVFKSRTLIFSQPYLDYLPGLVVYIFLVRPFESSSDCTLSAERLLVLGESVHKFNCQSTHSFLSQTCAFLAFCTLACQIINHSFILSFSIHSLRSLFCNRPVASTQATSPQSSIWCLFFRVPVFSFP